MKRFLIGLIGLAVLGPVARGDDKSDPKADRTAAVQGNTQFALDLYAQLRGQEGNLFFSPYSISTALAMTRAGAKGDTAAEMDKTLHFTLPPERLHPAFAALVKQVNGDPTDKKRGYQLSTANALWGQKDYGFKADFLKLLADGYGAGLNEVDYQTATDAARQTINGWVEKQTNDKIKDLLKPGDVTADTKLVLTNAIYFKGDWVKRFKKDLTKNAPFLTSADGKAKVNAPLMHQKLELNYFDGGTFQAVEMPYTGKDLSMVVLLPAQIDGLAGLEKDLTADKLAGWIGKLTKQEVLVSLPRFKTTQQMNMKKVLSELGMASAFSDKADLSGIGGAPGELRIADVIHKAFVDVNEDGTEAAAATAVSVFPGGLATPEFRADHPFVFLIRDTRSDSILFLGRVVDPTK